MDPLHGVVDEPARIEENATKPMHYVLAADMDGCIRDLTARYADKFLSATVRKLRTDSEWLAEISKLFKNRKMRRRDVKEDIEIRRHLEGKDLPTVVSEFKCHPLYVLKRDLLKFQGIYPEDCKPVGSIRKEPIYPRSAVYTLHSKESWIKEARVIKQGEKPYKVVKARPKLNLPKDEQPERPLDLYGFWQTEPYKAPPAKNGRVPRNEFGNVEVFKPCMIPPGTVHLKLPGLLSVAKKLDLDCAPAMVGWEFHCRGSHPLLDGFIVCKEHAKTLKAAWREEQAIKHETQREKRQQRALTNWKKLTKGVLTLHRVKKKFGVRKQSSHHKHTADEVLEHADSNDDGELMDSGSGSSKAWPHCKQQFNM